MRTISTVWYLSPQGTIIEPILNYESIEFAIGLGVVGKLIIKIPVTGVHAYHEPERDSRFMIIRKHDDHKSLENVFILNSWEMDWLEDGSKMLTIEADGPNSLLNRRIIPFAGDRTEGRKAAKLGDIAMWEVMNENFGANAVDDFGINREFTGADFFIVPASGDGPQIDVTVAYMTVLEALQEIQSATRTLGDEVYFFTKPAGLNQFIWHTSPRYPGRNLSIFGDKPLIFSVHMGNVTDVNISEEFELYATTVYVGGKGSGSEREVVSVTDFIREESAPLGRTETWTTSQAEYPDELQSVGEAFLNTSRIIKTLTGKIMSNSITPYCDCGWRLGDLITIRNEGVLFHGVIKGVDVRISRDGKEEITSQIEAVDLYDLFEGFTRTTSGSNLSTDIYVQMFMALNAEVIKP